VSYPEQIRYVGATPVLLEGKEDDGFLLTPAALEAALTPRTKAVILCSPSNPTGAAYSRDELVALLHVVRERDVYVIVDEIYADLVYDGFQHVSAGALGIIPSHRLIVVDGVSKTFAMTGWRIGWSISSPEIAEALDRLQGQSTSNPTSVAQAASAAALRGSREPVEHMRRTYQARRDLFVAGLNAIPGVSCRTPQGAFYAYANVKGLLGKRAGDKVLATDRDLATWALDEAFVASVAGEEFCAPGYLRMSYACSETDLRDGLASLRRAAERLV
jgi:aspartate aminotransferase